MAGQINGGVPSDYILLLVINLYVFIGRPEGVPRIARGLWLTYRFLSIFYFVFEIYYEQWPIQQGSC
jgi:hypothetical protein